MVWAKEPRPEFRSFDFAAWALAFLAPNLWRGPKANRPTIEDVVKRLMVGAFKDKMVKQIIIVHNKLVIYNEDQFDMVLCKNKNDAQRLHHSLAKIARKQKIKSLMFMGTATPATITRMYDLIKESTGWPIQKIKRTSTRP